MGKLFGQFLVEMQQITADQLLHALVHQLKSAPSTAEVLFEHNLLAKDDQLKVLAHQQVNGTDYRTSAKDLGLWNLALADEVSSFIQKARRPLGEVLVSLGYLDAAVLTKALDSYVGSSSSEMKSFSNTPPTNSLASEQSERPSPPSDLSTAASTLDPLLCAEYAENLNIKIIPALHELVSGSRLATKDDVDKFLRKALSEISALRAAATFAAAERSLQLANDLIGTITILKSSKIPPPADLPKIIDMIKFSTHVFDSLGQLIANFHSEDDFSSDVNLKDLFERVAALQECLRLRAVDNAAA